WRYGEPRLGGGRGQEEPGDDQSDGGGGGGVRGESGGGRCREGQRQGEGRCETFATRRGALSQAVKYTHSSTAPHQVHDTLGNATPSPFRSKPTLISLSVL
uniref:Uncharacterized protein n=1 Tax=Oryza brachyantha TaxID=4533 RepID=J3LPA3_ORYBR